MKIPPKSDERELLVKLRDGDQQAFETLYFQYSKRILINVLKLVKDTDEAQEILQDVFIRLWSNRKNIDPDKSFSSYLFTVAQNLVRDFFRKAALNRKMQDAIIKQSTELYEHVESNLYFKESNLILQNAIDSLPAQRKRIYTLCKIDGKSYSEAADILGISVSTVDNQLVKAVQGIKAYFRNSENYIAVLATVLITTI
jgi:RNA polymerase sigma-70 factor (family 1)